MDIACLICNAQNTRHRSVSGITCCIRHQLSRTWANKSYSKSSQRNNLNKKKVTSNRSIEPVPLNYLPSSSPSSALWKRCNLAHCPHAMQKKCKVVWSLLCHHHTLLPRRHQVMPSIYSLFTDRHISYLIQNCREGVIVQPRGAVIIMEHETILS